MAEKTYLKNDLEVLDQHFRKNFINCLSGFKSVNLMGTMSSAGVTNLAVFSQVVHVGASPALAGVLFRPHTVPRHSLENILDTHYFTLNHIHEGIVSQAHQTTARYEESEFSATGLSELYSTTLPAPYVKESSLRVGLKMVERLDVKSNGTIFIIGEILEIAVPDHVIAPDGFIDLEALNTLTCSGLDAYHRTEKLARFSYPKPGLPLTQLPD